LKSKVKGQGHSETTYGQIITMGGIFSTRPISGIYILLF